MSKMIIKALLTQRKEDYQGQYAPELQFAIDEFSHDENPELLEDAIEQIQEALKSGNFVGFAVVDINVDQIEIRQRCIRQDPPMEGEIQDG